MPQVAIESLRCFVEAARLLSFRAAAKSVALSPAAFGQRIKQLEEEIGERLFHRTTRTVVLTEAGLRALPHAEGVLAGVDDCVRAGRGEVGPPPREIVLGTRHELGLSHLVPALPEIEAAHPGLTLHLYFGSGPDLVRRVRALEIDAAITSTRLTDPKLDSEKLHEEHYMFVAAPKLLKSQKLVRSADAAHHTLVDASEGLPLFHYFRDAPGGIDSLRFERVLSMGTIAAIRQIVLLGRGVAVLPAYFVAADIAAGKLQAIMPKVKPLSDRFRLVFRRDDPRRSFFVALAGTLRALPLR